MAARTLMLKLECGGHVRLPSRQDPSPNTRRNRNDRAHRIRAAVKDVYLYALILNFRDKL